MDGPKMEGCARPYGFPKRGRVKLSGAAYRKLKQEIFALDGWRCKICGATNNLSLDHYVLRSTLRLDTVENCFTCCISCNQARKDKLLVVVWDAERRKVTVIEDRGKR